MFFCFLFFVEFSGLTSSPIYGRVQPKDRLGPILRQLFRVPRSFAYTSSKLDIERCFSITVYLYLAHTFDLTGVRHSILLYDSCECSPLLTILERQLFEAQSCELFQLGDEILR